MDYWEERALKKFEKFYGNRGGWKPDDDGFVSTVISDTFAALMAPCRPNGAFGGIYQTGRLWGEDLCFSSFHVDWDNSR